MRRLIIPVISGSTIACLVFASLLSGGLQEFFATAAYVGIVLSALALLLTGRAA
ncbi:MAG: hypothetical protein ACXWNK_16115 [Vulcanimicrobiaceae bacterium]